MEHLSNDHKECPNQHKNSHKLFNKMGHPVANLMESQWKLRYNMIRSSQWRQSHCRTNTSIRRKKKIQKSRTMIITIWDLFLFYFCNYFCLKKLHLRCCIGLELNILTWSTKVIKVIGVNLYDLEKTWKILPPRCPKNTFPNVFQPLSLLHLISNGLNRVDVDCGLFINFLHSMFSKGIQIHLISSNAT